MSTEHCFLSVTNLHKNEAGLLRALRNKWVVGTEFLDASHGKTILFSMFLTNSNLNSAFLPLSYFLPSLLVLPFPTLLPHQKDSILWSLCHDNLTSSARPASPHSDSSLKTYLVKGQWTGVRCPQHFITYK